MKVDGTGFTPINFQQTQPTQKKQPDVFQNQIAQAEKTVVPQKTEQAVQTRPVAVVEQAQSEEQSSSAMSAYLNAEEKQMLNMLFPPAGRNFGVRAYSQVQTPVRHPDAIGKNIDILS